MNLQEIRTFLAIVECGSLVKASERLNVTQSTITARLKGLEEEIGQTLIVRQKSGAIPTAAGQRLQRYAQTISELWRQAQQLDFPSLWKSLESFGDQTATAASRKWPAR